jgi:hypothetical protein
MAEYHKPLNIKTNLKLRCKYVASQFFIFYVDKLILNVPIKEVTDKEEIQKYFDDGYSHYLIGNNNATYVMVEFKDSTADDYQGNIFMIPKK